MRTGEAWYTTTATVQSFQHFTGLHGEHAQRKITTTTAQEEKWFPAGGEEQTLIVDPTGPGDAGGRGTPSAAAGFGDWDAMSAPTTTGPPTVVLRQLDQAWQVYLGYPHGDRAVLDKNHSAFTTLARAAAILGDEPVRPAVRGVLFRALAALPSLGYEKTATDPLGRRGVAVTETTSNVRAFAKVPGPQRYTFQLIFNPATGTVLGARTVAGAAIPALRVQVGQVLFSWAYRLSRVVASTSHPTNPFRATGAAARPLIQAEMRSLTSTGAPCHGQIKPGGGTLTRACQQAMNAADRRTRAALAHSPEVIAQQQKLLTPPPPITTGP